MIITSVRAADLRNLVAIQSLPALISRNSDGSEKRTTEQWSNLWANVPAKIDTAGGLEFYTAKQVNDQLTHEITIRWHKGVQPTMRVLFNDPVEGATRYFDIRAVLNPNNGVRWILLLHCRELVGREAQT